jgi:hypothetical protein
LSPSAAPDVWLGHASMPERRGALIVQRTYRTARCGACADRLAVPTKQLVRAPEAIDVSGKFGSCRTLSGAVCGVVGLAGLAVAKPVQRAHAVGVQGEHGSSACEQLDPLNTRPADPGVGVPWRADDVQLGTAAQSLDPVGRPWPSDDRCKLPVTGRKDRSRIKADAVPQRSHAPIASGVVNQIGHVLAQHQFPPVCCRDGSGRSPGGGEAVEEIRQDCWHSSILTPNAGRCSHPSAQVQAVEIRR